VATTKNIKNSASDWIGDLSQLTLLTSMMMMMMMMKHSMPINDHCQIES